MKELLKQWMAASSPVKINKVPLKEWMTATLSVTKVDTILQTTLTKSNAKNRPSKKAAVLNK